MSVTDDLKAEAWAPESDLPFQLVVISHATLAVPIRVVNNNEDVTHLGDIYTAFAFEVILPESQESAPPQAGLRIDNVSREIIQAMRTITTPATVTLKVIRRSAPDVVELELPSMRLTNIQGDAMTVEGDLEYEDLTQEPYPAFTFSPAEFPGLVG